ncbi:DEAD/DEAH box helicase [Methanosphaerula subterraneus]|uniref:DEAD/DEAH box helicase n=1 Tax=Methanosphaerula subterraneus TaxID=3350244 RepID=UPI003F84D212
MPATDQLDPRVRACFSKRGFEDLSPAQEQAIPLLVRGKHLLLIAPTGTGKTESAMLPVFSGMLSGTGGGFQALYITPLRALNRDILGRMEWWCRELGLTVGVRHGDTPASERRKQSLSPPDLLITTPETLQALFMGRNLRKHLANVRYVIIDEIHELAGSKRGAQLSVALERLAVYAGGFQRIGLSATVGNPEEIAAFLCGSGRPSSIVQVPVSKYLDLNVIYAGEKLSAQARCVERALATPGSHLVFTNTRVTAEALGHLLYDRGDLEVHHGSLSKEVRIAAEDRFRNGEITTLICTSSMELGIDIGHVEQVVQFSSPREVSRLIQRVGRAGHRMNRVSHGTVLATGFDDLLESLVIARRAKANEVENVRIPRGAGDVLANQVAAIAVEYGEITRAAIRAIIERASPFAGSGPLLDQVCEQMAVHRLIRLEGDLVITTGRARRYLTANLSMIQDERKVPVFDMVSRRTVGTLDESFVVGWVTTGAVFITKGQLWRVLDIEDGRLIVEPATKAKGELPSWEGEQIPVPFEVAREVGQLRGSRQVEAYTDSRRSASYVAAFLSEMDKNRSVVPTDRLITLENTDEGVICNICAGHRANEVIGRVLSLLLSARYGTSVGIEIDAYRVLLRLPGTIRAGEVKETLLSLEPTYIQGILEIGLKRTALYKWKLVQVAKKFGAIDADADFERISIHRLSELFDKTVIQQEAYRELFSVYMDVEGAARVVGDLKAGSIAIAIGRVSILGAAGLFSSRDLIPPASVDIAVLGTIRRRIDEQNVILCCMHCRKWKSRTKVSRVPDQPVCPNCGAKLIAALKPWDEPLYAIANKKNKNAEERAVEVKLIRTANIVLSSGKKAVVALSGRGVGPEHASRILATLTEGDPFYREILKAERHYVQTHQFW